MRRHLLMGAAALASLTLLLSGCSSGFDTGTGSTSNGGDKTARPAACEVDSPYVAVALPNLTNPFYVSMKQGFEKAGKDAGFKIEVQIADDDDAAQLAQVQAMLQKKPCALALNPVKSEPAAAIVKAANDVNVPVFTVNAKVDEESLKAQNAFVTQYLGADNVAGGQTIADMVLEDFGKDADLRIGFVNEPDETAPRLRDEGFKKAIASDPNAKVVDEVDGNVKMDDSLKAATELLSGHPDINVIFANTAPSVYGTLQALQGNSKVKLYGFCAPEEPLSGPYVGCVAQQPGQDGADVIGQIVEYIDGKTPKATILKDLKAFRAGETPAAGLVG
ncbi:substrate-binding domain-containing protein [Bifidobacterium aquikefiricola]|uniref:Substrate-binding domain-containing protein n=1 Tax=Bifidobacterium aquikefiricola TaxID=3059038 RepID=A0AB39U6Q8_9BIFI